MFDFNELPSDVLQILRTNPFAHYLQHVAIEQSWTRQHFLERLVVELSRQYDAVLAVADRYNNTRPIRITAVSFGTNEFNDFFEG